MTSDPILSDDEPYSIPSMPTQWGGDPAALGRVDHYDILHKLGGGGFGVVYLARDTASGVEVAIKTLHPLLKHNAEEMDLLREKFRLVSRLTHTNIAKALVLHPCRDINIRDEAARAELKLSPGDSVMVMDYAPGVTLSRWRRQFPDGIVPFDLALEVGRQVASALDYAHSERIVHRDVKPGNIMVETLAAPPPATGREAGTGANGGASRPGDPPRLGGDASPRQRIRVRLLDFGLAAEIRSSMSRVSTEQGDTSGTRPYMAPEQWLGRKQDGRTDQYALACVLYELLSGAPPFAGVFETGDLALMKDTVVRDTPEVIAGCTVAANVALCRALAKDLASRFPSCGEFVENMDSGNSGQKSGNRCADKPWRRFLPRIGVSVGLFLACALGSLLFVARDRTKPVEQGSGAIDGVGGRVVGADADSYGPIGSNHFTPWGTWEDPGEIDGFDRRYLDLVGTGDNVEILVLGETYYIEEGTLKAFRRSGFTPNANGKWVKSERTKTRTASKREKNLSAQNPGRNGGEKKIDLGGGIVLEMINCPDVPPDFSNFWIGRYEVTQAQWMQVTGTDPWHVEGPERPVEYVSWNDCKSFVRKLNALPAVRKSGLTFRLPTENEWRTACLAGARESSEYCLRDDGVQVAASTLSTVANYGNNESVDVGQLRPNGWGLFDMHGNVEEWTESRVSCGGSFSASAEHCSAAFGFTDDPDRQRGNLGFRLAATGIEPKYPEKVWVDHVTGYWALPPEDDYFGQLARNTVDPQEFEGQWGGHSKNIGTSALVYAGNKIDARNPSDKIQEARLYQAAANAHEFFAINSPELDILRDNLVNAGEENWKSFKMTGKVKLRETTDMSGISGLKLSPKQLNEIKRMQNTML